MKRLGDYEHVIWDWNGTLFDDVVLCVDVMNSLLRPRGLEPLSLDRYRDLFDFPVREYYRTLGFDFDRESFERVGMEFIERYEARRGEAGLRPEALRVLRAIQAGGGSQSVLSAYHQDALRRLVGDFGIGDCFVRLVGLQDHYAHGKLDQGLRWIRELHHLPHDVILVGDCVHDHEVASAMGVDCVLLAGGHPSTARLRACGVPVLNSPAELPV